MRRTTKKTARKRGAKTARAMHQRRHRTGTSRHTRRHRRHTHARENYSRGGAMENPLGGAELIVGGLAGLFGFGTADIVDRLLATHALTDTGTKDANGFELYTDTPPTTGNYPGLYNATSVLAPMSITRWAAGLGIAAVPLVAAQFVRAPVGRSALQFYGFGAGIRILGKGLSDLASGLMKKTSSGQRLYDAELRAQLAAAGPTGATGFPTLPSTGLGYGHGFGCGCMSCAPSAPPQLVGPQFPWSPQNPTGYAPPTQVSPPVNTQTPIATAMGAGGVPRRPPPTNGARPTAYTPPKLRRTAT